mmetsp:Transcript_10907/g.16537  ORF Transcript_10907/g.16537 Transcript_10907/m.16537 type:complete len:986 (+) Transcript_10907:268-3225(+)
MPQQHHSRDARTRSIWGPIQTRSRTRTRTQIQRTTQLDDDQHDQHRSLSAWIQSQEFAGDDRGAQFGDSVDIITTDDGSASVIAIGARFQNVSNDLSNAGSVRLFHRDTTRSDAGSGSDAGKWMPMGDAISGTAFGQRLGRFISLSSDGKMVAIGSPMQDSTGTVRVFMYTENQGESNGRWNQVGNTITNRGSDCILSAKGLRLAIRRDVKVKIYDWNITDQKWDVSANFNAVSSCFAFSSDGNSLAIGSPPIDASSDGFITVHQYYGGTWFQTGQDITVPNASNNGMSSMSLSQNGNTLAVGGGNIVSVYKLNGNAWGTKGGKIFGDGVSSDFGRSISLSDNGNKVVIGAPGTTQDNCSPVRAGFARVYMLNEEGGEWMATGQFQGSDSGDRLGFSVAMSGNGDHVIVGLPFLRCASNQNFGSAQVHQLPATASPTQNPIGSPILPTKSPTKSPTPSPTSGPTPSPTKIPTKRPTKPPTRGPTKIPTASPSKKPVSQPTSSGPTPSPTKAPTPNPTKEPTVSPTKSPTKGPTSSPTKSPSKQPTKLPTKNPTKGPASSPSVLQHHPSFNPSTSYGPTDSMSLDPSSLPSPSSGNSQRSIAGSSSSTQQTVGYSVGGAVGLFMVVSFLAVLRKRKREGQLTQYRMMPNKHLSLSDFDSLSAERQNGNGDAPISLTSLRGTASPLAGAGMGTGLKLADMTEFKYDVYLTHNWGLDGEMRNNHQRVSSINRGLERRGIRTHFLEEKVDAEALCVKDMSPEINSSVTVIAFVTEKYISQVDGEGIDGADDNCKLEFEYALRCRGVDNIITVVMENACADSTKWRGVVGSTLSHGSAIGTHASHTFLTEAELDGCITKLVDEIDMRKRKIADGSDQNVEVTPVHDISPKGTPLADILLDLKQGNDDEIQSESELSEGRKEAWADSITEQLPWFNSPERKSRPLESEQVSPLTPPSQSRSTRRTSSGGSPTLQEMIGASNLTHSSEEGSV